MKPYRSVISTCVLGVLVLPASAVITAQWSVETFPQFDAGDASSAFITSSGEVRPGWNTKRASLAGDAVWSALHLADGSVLLGSDAGGAIYRWSSDATKKLVSVPGAIAIVSMTQTSDGTVWAGAMPGDTLWRIDVANGKAVAGAKLKGVETIWSLAAVGTTVYAGTGPAGKVYSISAGKARQVFDTEDKRVTAMAASKDGAVWFGTSDRALVFRLDPKSGRTRAMADFAGNEVTAIAPYRDAVVVAANELADPPAKTGKTAAQVEAAEKPKTNKGQAVKAPAVGSKPGADNAPSAVTDLGRKGATKGKGALFRVALDGHLDQLHALTASYFTSVAVGRDGSVYAGAADKGRVYLVDSDLAVATAFDVDERSVSQLWTNGDTLGFATDDSAAVYRTVGRASQAKYISDVLDAKAVARFGRLTWVTTGNVAIETRSGNTVKPGVGWSPWQSPTAVAQMGGGNEGGKIASPPGRYLQFRAALQDVGAAVRRVTAYYAPHNSATAVQEVAIEQPAKDGMATLKDAAAKPRNPTLKVKWKIDNPDGDATTYTLQVRRDGDANWRPISTGKAPLTAVTWDWNTETYPDGWYRLRVTSSDAAANTADRAMTGTATSTMFTVDNTRPAIDQLRINYPRAALHARDALSTISEMAYSVDDGPWQLGATVDGLFDDPSEDLRIALPADLSRGPHTLAVRVMDSAGNIASVSQTFFVK